MKRFINWLLHKDSLNRLEKRSKGVTWNVSQAFVMRQMSESMRFGHILVANK
jgi:hypothetical protein